MGTNWSEEVKRKDGLRCRNCHAAKKLQAHHLYSQSAFPELKELLLNGITLCQECHQNFHKFCGELPAIPERFIYWYTMQQKEGKGKDDFQTILNLYHSLLRTNEAKKIQKMIHQSMQDHAQLDHQTSFDEYVRQFREVVVKFPPDLYKKLEKKSQSLHLDPVEFIFQLVRFDVSIGSDE